MKVLLAGATRATLVPLQAELADSGLELGLAIGPVEARRLTTEMRPDIVVLDIERGAGDWPALLSDLRAAAPVIVLTAEGREDDAVRAFDLGASDYLLK